MPPRKKRQVEVFGAGSNVSTVTQGALPHAASEQTHAKQRYELMQKSVPLEVAFAKIKGNPQAVYGGRSQIMGIGPLSVFRRLSIPHEEPDVGKRAAQHIAKSLFQIAGDKLIEVQCAVAINLSKPTDPPHYILSSNKNRDQIGDALNKLVKKLQKGRDNSSREDEVYKALLEKRVKFIDASTADAIASFPGKPKNGAADNMHAETLFLEADDILRQRGQLPKQYELIKVAGQRRPCTDCAHAFVIAGKAELIESASTEQPLVSEKRALAIAARKGVRPTFTPKSSAINVGRAYGSSGSIAGYEGTRQRLNKTPAEALTLVAAAINKGDVNPLRYHKKPNEAESTPLNSPNTASTATKKGFPSGK
ncbi:hypothetical protein [Herbaspirillum sp. alder98]|uniref:hypothetical protein n=1 Tax=Herbaspirillum sp. alder98 TaxID=2913096 RepID=UPI001CD8AE06|nr:hypothetical protein [Herbaspirillum sp. alder98]MCA1326780.1 hypothetical protein [Herbaspirillum sp. alder98]